MQRKKCILGRQENVLVIFCCVTSILKLKLKMQTFVVSVLRIRNPGEFSLRFWLMVSHELAVKLSAGTTVDLKSRLQLG